jgi:uncharacterized membrane protein
MASTTGQPAHSELDLASLFRRSWELFARKPVEHILAALIIHVLGGLTLGVLFGPLLVGYIRLIERQRRWNEVISVGQIFHLEGSGWSAFGASVLIVLTTAVGLVLFVVPGVVVLLGWGFALWFIALDRASATSSLGASWRLFKANAGSVVLVWIILAVLGSVGGAALIGTLITFPLGTLFATLAFHDMRGD